MAVGSITGGVHAVAYSNYINLSFTKPANTTKFIVVITDAVNTYTSPFSQSFTSSAATGSTVTLKVTTGINPSHRYSVSVRPYNGTQAGTAVNYINSTTGNTILTPSATITSTTSDGAASPQGSVTSNGSTSKTSQASPTGGGSNGGATVPSTGAGSNTPGGPTNATSTWVAGTIGNKPTDLGNTSRVPLKISNLELNQTYSITVVAVTTDVDGNTIHSEPSAALIVNTPPTTISGSNFSNSNIATDSQLSGGSIFAGDFPANSGLIDVVNGTTSGTGVILNQTGLAAFNQGIKEFYIDALTGKAYFAGNVTAGTVKIGPNVDPTGTKTGIYINDSNYWYQDGSWSAKGSDIAGALTSSSYTTMPKPPGVTNLVGSWVGADFKLTFSDDISTAPSGYTNSYFSYFLIKLVGNSGTRNFSVPAISGANQSFALSLSQNRAAFGVPQTSFSGSVIAVDSFGNKSAETTFTSVGYTTPLTAPTITVTSVTGGYSVTYTSQTNSAFLNATVYEVESTSQTDPGTGYQVVAQASSNPVIYIAPNYNQRWVKVRLYDSLGGYPTFSNAVAVTPLSSVGADNIGPANVSNTGLTATSGVDLSGYLGFNGYINLSWSAVSDTSLRGYRIRFTTDSGASPKYSYVDSPGNGTSYKLTGLAVGATYKIAIATYDEFNNTSTNYVSYSDVTIIGTPSVSNYITAGQFQFGSGVGGNSTNQGLYFNSSNYWYINSGTSALFNLGGSTSNYLSWDGSNFIIDGDLRARKGYFAGNVEIKSGITGGASIYSGTLNVSGNLTGAGFILNSSGLTFSNSTTSGITTIDAVTGIFTTKSAVIGGWQIATNANTIYKSSTAGTVTLDSDNARIDIANSSGNYHLAISAPKAGSSGTSYVAWAGAADNTASGIEAAKFKIAQDGTLYASGAVFSGYASSSDLSNYATNSDLSNYATNSALSSGLSTKINGSQVNTYVTSIDGGVIKTGSVKSGSISGTQDGSAYTGNGVIIGLDGNGFIASPKFRIDTSGNAYFSGSLTSGVSITAPYITGGTIVSALIKASGLVSSYPVSTSSDYVGSEADSSTYASIGSSTSSNLEMQLTSGYLSSNNYMILKGQNAFQYYQNENLVASFGTDGVVIPGSSITTGIVSTLGQTNSTKGNLSSLNINGYARVRNATPTGPSTTGYFRNIYIGTSSSIGSGTGYEGAIYIQY